MIEAVNKFTFCFSCAFEFLYILFGTLLVPKLFKISTANLKAQIALGTRLGLEYLFLPRWEIQPYQFVHLVVDGECVNQGLNPRLLIPTGV